MDVRIKRMAGQRDDLQDTVRRLKLDLEEERSRSSLARGAASMDEIERLVHTSPLKPDSYHIHFREVLL